MNENKTSDNNSFDNLLEELDGMSKPETKSEPKDIVDEIENNINKAVPDDRGIKTFTENGMTFVDVTAQYVKKSETEEKKPEVTEKQVKKIRTFNEIFSDFFGKFLPKKEDKKREKVRKVVMDISLVTIIGCVIAFGVLFTENLIQRSDTKNIHGLIVNTDDFDSEQYDEAWQELFSKYPSVEFPQGMNLKYAYLYAINPELVGWIKIDGTNLDVQVVQSKDNEKYLKTDFYGKKSRYGCPYLDFRNDAKYLNDNNVVYGHHMSDGLMFSILDKYKTVEGYKESPIIQYDTLYQTYYFKVFAAFVSNGRPEDDNGYLFNYTVTDFSSDDKFMSFIQEIQKRSIFNTNISVLPDDKILTLSTCSYEFPKARLVIVARLCRENEDKNVDTSEVTINPAPRYPQAWYDAKGRANPYKDDTNWTP